MRKTFTLIFLLLLLTTTANATIDGSMVWELRASATAGNVNGCGYLTGGGGTDFTLQDSSQDSGTDLDTVSDTVVSSATHNFVAADVGNIIHVTAGTGFTPGWYEILSVATNNATLDRAIGTHPITAATWAYGGACSLNSTLDDDFFEQTEPGNKVWVRDGNYSLGEGVNVAKDGTAASPIDVEGYNSSRGDNPTGTSRPDINVSNITFRFDNYWKFANLILTGTTVNVMWCDTSCYVTNLKVSNTSGTGGRTALRLGGAQGVTNNSEFTSTNGWGVIVAGADAVIGPNVYIHDSGSGCISVGVLDNVIISFNLLDSCLVGINATTSSIGIKILNNTIWASTTSGTTGIFVGANGSNWFIENNIISGFGTGINFNSLVSTNRENFNNLFANTTDRTNIDTGPDSFDTDPGFTDAAGGDFSVGTAMKATGSPGAFPGSSTTGYLDVGAVQRQEPAGGGGAASFTFVQ